ncbi:MAG: CRISPR-associated protein Cas5 [Flavonifractor plautii]
MSIQLEVWGDYAPSRIEFKTERVSYDVMTPSAARGWWRHPLASWAEVDHRPHPCVRSHPLHQSAAQRGQVHSPPARPGR